MKSTPTLITRVALILAAIGFSAGLVLGQTSPAAAKDQILTKRTVKLFLTSYPDIRAIAERHANQKGIEIIGATDQLAAVIRAASDETVASEIDAAAKSHGFSGAPQWVSVATAVGRAYAFIQAGDKVSKANKQLEKAIAKIEKNDFLSPKQKRKLIKALREGAGEILEEPPEENIAAVQPMTGEINAVVLQ